MWKRRQWCRKIQIPLCSRIPRHPQKQKAHGITGFCFQFEWHVSMRGIRLQQHSNTLTVSASLQTPSPETDGKLGGGKPLQMLESLL